MCALRQLRLVTPVAAELVTGSKLDIDLLNRVEAGAGDEVTVLDIPLDQNRAALLGLLERGARVHYFDHHATAEIPHHPLLTTVIDPSPDLCTGLLVDRQLHGRYRVWAIVAAYGDNLSESAQSAGAAIGLTGAELYRLRILGQFLNYNSFGELETDLIVHPAELYRVMCHYPDPYDFLSNEPLLRAIAESRHEDMGHASRLPPLAVYGESHVCLLPNVAWGRRVRGALANDLAEKWPKAPHAVLAGDAVTGYMVSLRAPENAGTFCRRFAGGGGRPRAAGIRRLPHERLDEFVRQFQHYAKSL